MARGRGSAHPGAARGRGRGRGRVGGGNSPGAVANAQASTEYNPGIRETREQIKGSRKRQGDLGSWYRQLAADYQGAQNAGSAALNSIEEATGKQLAEAGERSSADQARLASEDAGFSKLVGGPQNTAGLSKIADAGAAAARSQVSLNLPVEQQQANFVGRLGADKAAARLQGIEARLEERGRRDKLKSDLTAQRKEKGAARVSAKSKLLEAKAAQAAEAKKLALEEQEARAAERQAAASQSLAQIEAARKARSEGVENRQEQERIAISRRNAKTSERSQRNSAKQNKSGLTPSEARTARRAKNSANVAAVTLYKAAGSPNWSDQQWTVFVQRLAMEDGIDYTAAQEAVANLRAAVKAKAATRNRRLHEGKVPGH